MAVALFVHRSPGVFRAQKRTPAPPAGHINHPAIRSLQQHGRSNYRHDDHDGSDHQPVSSPSPCPCRPRGLLLRLVCGALGCPSGLFFLLRFLRFSHGLPLCYRAVVVGTLAVSVHPPGARSDGRCDIPERHHPDSARLASVWRHGGLQAMENYAAPLEVLLPLHTSTE
jgi:hypothetical protein